ncbi:MAG: class I SAM-dependent methyltransferase [Candidatus Altiarchaeota archaeon]|nr:class I SAM-dependent methyltransferase [Candidatus Altiarchaeota archaeon]
MDEEERLRLRAVVLREADLWNKSVLDIGAGPLAFIAVRDYGCKVTSIDLDDKRLLRYKKKAEASEIRGIDFKRGDVTSLSYPDDSFDAVICYGALHHIASEDRGKCVREMFRVAREKVVIADYSATRFKKTHPSGYEMVDFRWLESELKKLGKYSKNSIEGVNIYVCDKK